MTFSHDVQASSRLLARLAIPVSVASIRNQHGTGIHFYLSSFTTVINGRKRHADACERLAKLKTDIPGSHTSPLIKAMQLHYFAEQIRRFTYNTLKGKAVGSRQSAVSSQQ